MSSIVFGIHAVNSLLEKSANDLDILYLQDNFEKNKKLNAIENHARELGITCRVVKRQKLDEMVSQANHQGIVAQTQAPHKRYSEKDLDALLDALKEPVFLLILDQIQDPHNLGACLRTAAAAGVHAVIAPKDGAASITPVVKKVACGAVDIVPYVQVTNLSRIMKILQDRGIWITGTAVETDKNLYDIDFSGDIALVIGAEGKGMRRLVKEHCDYLVKIPMPGEMESLNASVATGVCLFEVVRQRKITPEI